MSKRWPWLILLVALVALLWATMPPRLSLQGEAPPALPVPDLVPGTEAREFKRRARSDLVVVAIHGFSASRQETAPLAALVAGHLDANLLEVRLTGHGHLLFPMEDVRAEHWLEDARQALARAAEIGDRVVVIGTSTGATLATLMLQLEGADAIDSVVMISPNFAPRDPQAAWATKPLGPQLARLLIGETRCFEPYNALQAEYWSTCYPTAAAIEMMRLVDAANRTLPASVTQRLLMFYSAADEVVSPQAALRAFENFDAPLKEVVEITKSGDPSNHVLVGDILSPQNTQDIANTIAKFIRRPIP